MVRVYRGVVTSRDTHDIVAYQAETASLNVQPSFLVKLMEESEPKLFSGERPVATYVVPEWLSVAVAKMNEWTKWHAELQIAYERSLKEEGETA
mgnify:CR=1 FL=1